MPKGRLRLFLVLMLVAVALMTYQSRKGPLRPFQFLSYPLNLTASAYLTAKNTVVGTFNKYRMRDEAFERLQLELQALRMKSQRYDELVLQSTRLRKILAMKDSLRGYVATARVISRGSDRWANSFVIDRGDDARIEKDMAVITPEGLLGKVGSVYGSYSTVLLIDDPRFSVGVRLQDSRVEAVYSGAGPRRGVLKYVETDTPVTEGARLLTSGLDGLFPPGVPMGFITSVSTHEEAMFHQIEAMPFVDTTRVEEVIILQR